MISVYLVNKSIVIVPANVEIAFCVQSFNGMSSGNTLRSTDREEILNDFGLKTYKRMYPRPVIFDLNHLSSNWLLFNPSKQWKKFPNDQIDNSIPLRNHDVTLVFGSLISPYRFKCAESKFIYQMNSKLFFAKHHSYMSIIMGNSRFTLRRDHVDSHRGIIINIKSMSNIVVYICLRGNLEEYELQHRKNGMIFFSSVKERFF